MVTNILRAVLLFTSLALGAATALAQSPPPPPLQVKPPDVGRLEGVNYVNDFFGLTLAVPQDWVVIGGAQRGAIMDATKKMLTTDDERKQMQLEASMQRTIILLSLAKLPVGSTQGRNATFMLLAERVPAAGEVEPADIVRAVEESFKGTSFKLERQGPVRTERVGGAEFAAATFRTTSPQGVYMQKLYAALKRGYALQLVYTYLDEADVPTFEAMLKSLSLK